MEIDPIPGLYPPGLPPAGLGLGEKVLATSSSSFTSRVSSYG